MLLLKIPEISNRKKNRTLYYCTLKFGFKFLQFVCVHSLADLRY